MSAKRPQSVRKASAIVRNRSQWFAKRSRRVGHAGESTESKIVAKRRTVVTFYVSHYKSVNSHGDRGGRHVSSLLSSLVSLLSSLFSPLFSLLSSLSSRLSSLPLSRGKAKSDDSSGFRDHDPPDPCEC